MSTATHGRTSALGSPGSGEDSAHDLRDATRELRSRFEDLKKDVSGLASSVQGLTSAAVGTAKDSAIDQANYAREKGLEWTSQLEACVRERPLTSVAIAVGVGYLLSVLSRR